MRSWARLTAAVALTTAWVIERYHPTLPDSARLRMHLRPVASVADHRHAPETSAS